MANAELDTSPLAPFCVLSNEPRSSLMVWTRSICCVRHGHSNAYPAKYSWPALATCFEV
jgi:hypothetical protein